MASKLLSRITRGGGGAGGIARRPILASSQRQEQLLPLSNGFHSLPGTATKTSLIKWVACPVKLQHSVFGNSTLQRFGFSSSAPQPAEEEANNSSNEQATVDQVNASENIPHDGGGNTDMENGSSNDSSAKKRRKSSKRTAFSDSEEERDLSIDDLVKLVAEKEELLKLKHKEIEKMQDKVLRSYADMENVIDRTKRESENSKKFAIQNFAKSLLDVSDNLGRASSVVKESFSKIDVSKDTVGAVPLLKTLLEGVDMTNKQLAEVFRKFGVEKFDPTNEQFDPHRHLAVFQIPDASKPPGTVAAVLKPGYMLHDRIIRPAEVGVIQATNEETDLTSGN